MKHLQHTLLLSLTSLAFCNDYLLGVRAGVDLTLMNVNIADFDQLNLSNEYVFPNLTVEITKPIYPEISIGLSATQNIMRTELPSSYSFNLGLNAYKHIHQHNSIGLGLNLLHIPIDESASSALTELGIRSELLGYAQRLQLGLSLRNYITDSVYAHIELLHDVSPLSYQPLIAQPTTMNDLEYGALLPLFDSPVYTTNIALGFSSGYDG